MENLVIVFGLKNIKIVMWVKAFVLFAFGIILITFKVKWLVEFVLFWG